MRENYFVKLIKYIMNVYHIDKQLEHISDKRINPTYKTSQIISIVLTGYLLRIKSFNQLSFMIKTGEFSDVLSSNFGVPKIDAIRNSLKSISIDTIRYINQSIIMKAVRNKVLNEGTLDGYTVAAIDGTNLFNTQNPHCDDCLKTNKRGKIFYSHSCTVMSLIGHGANLIIDYEMVRHENEANDTGESELIAARRLLNRAVRAHKGLIDVVAYDALACNSIFIHQCLDLKIDTVIRVKDNYNLSIRNVKKTTNKKKPIKCWNDGKYKIKAYESIFYMDRVESPFRYIKFRKKQHNGKRSQVLIITTAMDMSIKTVYSIMKARWNIENRVFNNLKNNANMNHCFVHGGKAVETVLYLMFIASNLFQLFKVRRLKNHVPIQKELVRLLLKGLYLSQRFDVCTLDTG